ncbi:hypothetical protein SynBMKMC1_00340 [Synechococcus sp. BMK-MC-1]|nr:hypothetical protein SynBMKMC1_00340 [Synechococcus sp. BMK-MC-1]
MAGAAVLPEVLHTVRWAPQCDQTGGRQALFRLIRMDDHGEVRIQCRASCPPRTTLVLMRASKLTSMP